jgi:hypothetical protein
MRELIARTIPIAKSAGWSYLLAVLAVFCGIELVSVAALVAGVHGFTFGIGPLPLMSFWNTSAGYGFQSEWGVSVLSLVGIVAGAVIATRRQQTERR